MTIREWKVATIRAHQYYESGALEKMSDAEVDSIFEELLDWMEV